MGGGNLIVREGCWGWWGCGEDFDGLGRVGSEVGVGVGCGVGARSNVGAKA